MVATSPKRKRLVVGVNESENQKNQNDSMEMDLNKWLDLPSCLFEKFFASLDPVDALLIIPLVCKDWGRILLKILFFKEDYNHMNFRPLMGESFNSIFNRLEDEELMAMNLMKILVGLMHAFASDGQNDADTCVIGTIPIDKISFVGGLPFYDTHLIYIAERYNYYPLLFCYLKNVSFCQFEDEHKKS
ncbi:hypothetical protein POM88_043247 [Heracleum sosnowskyi]|uniref:F-box domain-containing protein n=1 Tax=Heracleum sosnowskyi TaxID=360622 RepID=A0AAD8M494_9APIA|nr:hypothetical protein POM88_043247 [Heracleum sosnowskyi]